MDRHLESARSEIANLIRTQRDIQRAIHRKQCELLRNLPALVGLNNVDELMQALAAYSGDGDRAFRFIVTG